MVFGFVLSAGVTQSGIITGHLFPMETSVNSTEALMMMNKTNPKSSSKSFLHPPKPNLSLLLHLHQKKLLLPNFQGRRGEWRWMYFGCAGKSPG